MIDLIEVYKDTVNRVDSTIAVTTKYQDTFKVSTNSGNSVISVVNTDTVSAAQFSGSKTCVLNMASSIKAGGGVANGSRAQEECLFRCSDLFLAVPQDFYPLKTNEALYTKNSTFFKDKDYQLCKPFVVDVLTIAALNLNPSSTLPIFGDYEKITEEKIEFMLRIAEQNNVETLILGAWGCGVFKNDPTYIATLFKEKLKHYSFNVIFAVINDHNSVSNNYEIFTKILS